MQERPATTLSTRATVSGVWAVQRMATSTGPSLGRDPPPVEPTVDELRRSEVAIRCRCRPGVVEALAEHEPAAIGAPLDDDVATGPARRLDRDRRLRRRGLRRRAGSRVGEDDPIDVQPGRRAGRRRQAMAAGGERQFAGRARRRVDGVAGEEVGGRRLDADRQRLAVDGEEVLSAPGVESLRNGGRRADGDLADAGGQDDRLRVAAVDARPADRSTRPPVARARPAAGTGARSRSCRWDRGP